MFYIWEGADGSGKSTLAGKAGHFVVHNGTYDGVESNDLYHIYQRQLHKAATEYEINGYITSIDRCWLSEYVYGTVLRDETRLTLEQVEKLDALADRLGAVRVFCYAAPDLMEARCQSRGEELVGVVQRSLTRDLYQLYAMSWPCRLDTTRLNLIPA